MFLRDADELKPRRSRGKCSKEVPEIENHRAFQKTEYNGKLGEVSGSREDLLLQRLYYSS